MGAVRVPFAQEQTGAVRPRVTEFVVEKVDAGGLAPEPVVLYLWRLL